MIHIILPDTVVATEARADLDDEVLFPVERAVVAHAVAKRRQEFNTARACARLALARLGLPPCPITTGDRGEPLWPPGVVGSITHCHGYRACAVARSTEVATIGIDAEPNACLPNGVLAEITRLEELPQLARLAQYERQVHWDRVLFSAKESVYKAWYPLARRWLGFEDAMVVIDPARGTFDARLEVLGPVVDGRQIASFSGRWMARDGLVLTAVSLEVTVT
jgi:4'-phosphopantetheinyl transferase EntD